MNHHPPAGTLLHTAHPLEGFLWSLKFRSWSLCKVGANSYEACRPCVLSKRAEVNRKELFSEVGIASEVQVPLLHRSLVLLKKTTTEDDSLLK